MAGERLVGSPGRNDGGKGSKSLLMVFLSGLILPEMKVFWMPHVLSMKKESENLGDRCAVADSAGWGTVGPRPVLL